MEFADRLFTHWTIPVKYNNDEEYAFNIQSKPKEIGNSNTVFTAMYSGKGPNNGKTCCAKLTNGCKTSEDYSCSVSSSTLAHSLQQTFKDCPELCDAKKFSFVRPMIAKIDKVSKFQFGHKYELAVDDCVLIEPKLRGTFQNFCVGNQHGRERVLTAFAHYSWANTNGQTIIHSFKGVYNNGCYELCDPRVHSMNREFGLCDFGHRGIDSFFRHHTCNEICKDWDRPIPNQPSVSHGAPRIPSAPIVIISSTDNDAGDEDFTYDDTQEVFDESPHVSPHNLLVPSSFRLSGLPDIQRLGLCDSGYLSTGQEQNNISTEDLTGLSTSYDPWRDPGNQTGVAYGEGHYSYPEFPDCPPSYEELFPDRAWSDSATASPQSTTRVRHHTAPQSHRTDLRMHCTRPQSCRTRAQSRRTAPQGLHATLQSDRDTAQRHAQYERNPFIR